MTIDKTKPLGGNSMHVQRLNKAISACDEWFDKLPPGDATEFAVELELGPSLTIVFFQGEVAKHRHFNHTFAYDGRSWEQAGGDLGGCPYHHIEGRYYAYCEVRRLESGNVFLRPWMFQHEVHHALEHIVKGLFFANPDHFDRPGVYR